MTEQRIILNAPAKINLTLEVLKKRTDGYHDLRTAMHSIDVCDTVTVELSEATTAALLLNAQLRFRPSTLHSPQHGFFGKKRAAAVCAFK